MDIIENWTFLNERMKKEYPEVVSALFPIHMGCFDELRNKGCMLSQNGKTIDQIAATLEPSMRLQLAGNVGRSLIKAEGSLKEKHFKVSLADEFPCCIFVAMAAILENLDGAYNENRMGQKMKVTVSYQSDSQDDPFGIKLPILHQCFSWMTLIPNREAVVPRAVKQLSAYSLDDATVLVRVTGANKVDSMRTAFSGTLLRGSIRHGDILHVLDQNGLELCRSGTVRLIAVNGSVVQQADTGSSIDELCLTTELKSGDYDSICLAGFSVAHRGMDIEHDTVSGENHTMVIIPDLICAEKGHDFAWKDINDDGVTKRKLICKCCGKVFHIAEVKNTVRKTVSAELQNLESSSPLKVSESDLNLYRGYMKPSLWDNLLFWIIFSAVLFGVGIFGVSVGSVLYGVIFIIVGVALLSFFVYSYGNETEKYRRAMADPKLSLYAADFSKSEIFRGDAFRMGTFNLYKHGSPIPVDYQNIDRIRIDVRKKIFVTGFLKIYMKNDNIGVNLCELSGKDLRPGPENDLVGKMITKLQAYNPSIRFQQQELLFNETFSVDSEPDEHSEISSEKGSEQAAETPILLISDGGTVKKYRLSGRQILGRPSQQGSPELAVRNQHVSHRHGEFFINSDLRAYRDLNSTNGTLLNGVYLEPMVFYDLQDGDVLRISTSVSIVYFDKDYTEEQDVEEKNTYYS